MVELLTQVVICGITKTFSEERKMDLFSRSTIRLAKTCATLVALPVMLLLPPMAQATEVEKLGDDVSYTAQRLSSVDPEHKNSDRRPIEPGQTLELGEIKGAGKVTHMWFTIWADSPDYLKELVVRAYWDGDKQPAVECPLGDFFALGFGKLVDLKSAPVVIGEHAALNCYWPMPFAKGARFTITNEGSKPIKSCYYNVDYQLDKQPSDKTYYFHTQYRQSYPAPSGKDYTVLDTTGRGKFVGCFLSLLANADGWWGEGNDKFYVDGATTPTIEGTGSEDYFCGAWNFGGAMKEGRSFYTDYFGVPLYDSGEKRGIRNTCYRWHVLDPVPFTSSLKFALEHGKNGSDNVRTPSPNNYSTVAFYYVDHTAADGTPLPGLAQRDSQLIPIEKASVK
jgi:hypothetical protein